MLKVHKKILIELCYRLIKIYSYSTKFKVVHHSSFDNKLPDQFVQMMWHQSILSLIMESNSPALQMLISTSKDGDYLIELIKKIKKIEPIRGSSRRHTFSAVREMIKLKKSEKPVRLIITPDGPLGPYKQVKEGLASIITKLDIPIVPCVTISNNHWNLNTWDRHLIPKPRSLNLIYYGKAISPNTSFKELQQALEKTEIEAKNILETL